MKLQLIASMPGKSLENKHHFCVDGRGGWTLSQLNVDRCVSDYRDFYLVFCLGVLAPDVREVDFVESSRMTAKMGDWSILKQSRIDL